MSNSFFQALASLLTGPDRSRFDAQILREQMPRSQRQGWKYAWLDQLGQRRFERSNCQQNAHDLACIADIPFPRLTFVNGVFRADLSDTSAIVADVSVDVLRPDPIDSTAPELSPAATMSDIAALFRRLNRILADTCVRLRVRAGAQVNAPLHLVYLSIPSDVSYTWHHQHHIYLERHASLHCIEHHLDVGQSSHYANTLAQITLEPQARLHHLRILATGATMTSAFNTDAVLDQASYYQRTDLDVTTGHSVQSFNARLVGQHAHLDGNGVLIGGQNAHIDHQLQIAHAASDTHCDLRWRGMAHQKSAVALEPRIHILAQADQAQAQLSSKNLVLAPTARMQAQPILVIDADNVRAAHGATVGQLDSRAIFYLRSRGIPSEQAIKLLGAVFCQVPLTALPEPSRLWAQRYVKQAIERTCNDPNAHAT